GLDERIEDIGFAETREVEMVDGVADLLLVLGKINLDAGFHVESFQSDQTFWLQVREKSGRTVPGVSGEPAVGISAELHEHNHGNGCFGGRKVGYGLGNAVVEDSKIFLFKVGNEIAVLRSGYYVESHDGHIDADADVGLGRLLPRGRGLLGRGLLLLLRRRGAALRACGSLSKGGPCCERRRQSGRQSRE